MNRLKSIFFCFFCICFLNVQAQKFELGKVSVKELEETTCPIDTNAVAAILYSKAKTVFKYKKEGFFINHIYEFKIKIYKKEGLNWANFKIPYYIGYKEIRNDVVTFSDGVTYNLVNNEIEKTKLKSEGKFDTNLNQYWNEASITLPNVQVGSVIEFKYTISSERTVKFPVFNFQYTIPVKYAEYKTEVPEYFIYSPITSGSDKITSKSDIGFGNQNFDDEHNQGIQMSYKQINSLHFAENVPALIEEDFVDNIENYKASIDYELQKTRFPEVPEKVFTQTWEDVARSIYKDPEFGKQLKLKGQFTEDLKLILKDNDSTSLDKVNTIFKFVQNKMNWNNYYGYYTDKGVLKAYQEGTGNIADINFILISMLNSAGIKTNPVVTSTISNGISLYPNRTFFNYVIALAEVDGKKILLDASNKYTTINILPLKVLNWVGRLIREDASSEEINLLPTVPSKDQKNILAIINSNGKITGKIRRQKSDYEALRFRMNFGNTSNETYLENLESNYRGFQVTDYTIENKVSNLSKPIVETFNFSIQNEDKNEADRLYINPLLIFTQSNNPFNQEKRVLPIYFGYPKHSKYNINFEIPEGYGIEFMPKSISITIPDIAQFSYKIIAQDNKIAIVVSLENNSTILSASYHEDFKEFYKKAIEKQSEKIILKKL